MAFSSVEYSGCNASGRGRSTFHIPHSCFSLSLPRAATHRYIRRLKKDRYSYEGGYATIHPSPFPTAAYTSHRDRSGIGPAIGGQSPRYIQCNLPAPESLAHDVPAGKGI